MSLPYPTKTRLELADAIVARHIRHYHFIVPSTLDTARNREVTARVKEFVAAGLAEYGTPDGDDVVRNWSTVRLTTEGMAWVTRARTSDVIERGNAALLEALDEQIDTEANLAAIKNGTEGPVSTSPETGPGGCTGICDREPEGEHAHDCPYRETT